MAKVIRFSVSMSEDEVHIADAIAKRKGISRSELFRHLILYQGLCGGTMPLTSKILSLPEEKRERVIEEILKSAKDGSPAKPQSFALWVKETLGSAEPDDLEAGAEELLKELLKK